MPGHVPAQSAERAIDLVLGMLAHAASVEQDDVGVGRLISQFVPLPPEGADDELAIQHIHLAADSFDV